jgi:hypothetical protein
MRRADERRHSIVPLELLPVDAPFPVVTYQQSISTIEEVYMTKIMHFTVACLGHYQDMEPIVLSTGTIIWIGSIG